MSCCSSSPSEMCLLINLFFDLASHVQPPPMRSVEVSLLPQKRLVLDGKYRKGGKKHLRI